MQERWSKSLSIMLLADIVSTHPGANTPIVAYLQMQTSQTFLEVTFLLRDSVTQSGF